jgi:hypothetical protein
MDATMKFDMRQTKFDRRAIYLVISLCSALMAISYFIDPPVVRPTGGRWGGFFAWIWDGFGSTGIQGYWILLSVVFFGCYILSKK